MIKNRFFYILIFLICLVFYPFLIKGHIPVPTDALIGMYYPHRNLYKEEYPQGVPFKNFLITDSIRQIIPWKKIGLDLLKKGKIPLWNPYNFSGTPLLANIQSSPFYPLNIFLIADFKAGWGIFILLQSLLGAIFLFLYLKSLKIHNISCILSAFVWVFSGFFVAWLEWGNIIHTVIWLPLILLSIDKITTIQKSFWKFVFIFSLYCAFSAGHLQSFFYLFLFSSIYFFWRQFKKDNFIKSVLFYTFYLVIFIVLTAPLWNQILNFIYASARSIDIRNILTRPDWFLPIQHLIQILIPDFFGNPSTLNYWGVWNYGEFISYIGIIPFFFAIFALLFVKKSKIIRFYSFFALIFLSFALPTPWAKIPFILKIPLLSTAQPSRLIVLVDFCLVILSAFGFDHFIKNLEKKEWFKKEMTLHIIFILTFAFFWFRVYKSNIFNDDLLLKNLNVAKRNLIFPSLILFCFLFFCWANQFFKKFLKKKKINKYPILCIIFFLTFFDLFRFFHKFTPFTLKKWFFPQTETINFLKKDKSAFRVAYADKNIMPGNISTYYKIQSVNGYDPLYLKNYAKYIIACQRGEPNINPPFGFNRIVDPNNYESPLFDLLNVKYILSNKTQISNKLKKVFQEEDTIVYENIHSFPRAFLVYESKIAKNELETIKLLYDENIDLKKTAIVYEDLTNFLKTKGEKKGQVEIVDYQENTITLKTTTNHQAILVLSEVYYPIWKAMINDRKTKIFPVNFLFRGIIIPKGENTIIFFASLF